MKCQTKNRTIMALKITKNSKVVYSPITYVDYWDRVIEQWLQNNFNCSELKEQENYGKALGIGNDSINNRLPEPYWGDPYNCSFVIMGYNPGPCHDSRHNYRFCAGSQNCMIHEIKKSKYSDFAKSFPLYRSLSPTESWFEDSIGRRWWLKQKENWIDNALKKMGTVKLPFAMEFCAWHSDQWDGIKAGAITNNSSYLEILMDAFVESIGLSDSHIGICFGCDFRNCKTFGKQIENRGFVPIPSINGHHIYEKGVNRVIIYCKGDRHRYPSKFSEIAPLI